MRFLQRGNGPAIACIPKNASFSIMRVMGDAKELTPDEAMRCDVQVAFIRDPVDRLQSLYSFLYWIEAKPNARHNVAIGPFDCWQEFIDQALISSDPHVLPQSDLISDKRGQMPNRLHWLKDIAEVWGDYYPGMVPDKSEFPHSNRAMRLPCEDYRMADIKQKYEKDYELCRLL